MQAAAGRRDAGAIDGRLALRLVTFVAGSLVLHALLLAGHVPRPSGEAWAPAEKHSVVRAVIAPVSPGGAGVASSPADVDTASSGQPGASLRNGANLPRPNKWFRAVELDVLAIPTTLPKFEYPHALAGSGVNARVQILLFIDERGIVRRTEVLKRGPMAEFDTAATQTWKSVVFIPAMKAGIAVKSQKLLEVQFQPE